MARRRSVNVHSWEYITKGATEPHVRWTNSELAKFHYMNKNGVYFEHRRMVHLVGMAVKAGFIRSGWYLAYCMSTQPDTLSKYARMKKVKATSLHVTVQMIKENTAKALSRLQEEGFDINQEVPNL